MHTAVHTKSNVILLYTILSAIVTASISLILIIVLSAEIRSNLIKAHSTFYSSFADAIPSNYSEVLVYFNIDIPEQHDDHDHIDHEIPNISKWSHFQSDISQNVSVLQFRVFDVNKNEIWNYIKPGFTPYPTMINLVSEKNPTYHVLTEEPVYIIHYYFPLYHNTQFLGTVEITDSASDLSAVLQSSNFIIMISLLFGGILMYIFLFVLFYNAYKSQNKAIQQLDKSQLLTIHSMSLLAELRDNNTGEHIIRTSNYCKILAKALQTKKAFTKYVSDSYIADIERSAPLHDIGKVGIPDSILNKPGLLTPDEFNIIKKHPSYGASILQRAMDALDFQSYFEIGYQLVLHHHENWDGSGYPSGLKGDEIPLSARIMSIADVYDALTTDRPYKHAFTHEKAIDIITADSGKKFDPRLVEILLEIQDAFKQISNS